jgi:hypothetical protein
VRDTGRVKEPRGSHSASTSVRALKKNPVIATSISPKPAARYGITHSGWGWTVAFRRSGVEISRHFSAKLYQGEEAALAFAKAWRDEMLRAHPPVARQVRAQTLRSPHTTGKPRL